MARTAKIGLDYFPFDIDFFNDEKIEFVSARFGMKGEIITIRLLCKIYRNGYFTEWNDDECTLFAKRAGDCITPALVKEIVQELVKRGFFDKSLLNSFAVLSSKGIQQRYFDATVRREYVPVFKEYLLLKPPNAKNVHINSINDNINRINDNINSQSKVEESKEEEKEISPNGDKKKNPYFEKFELWIKENAPYCANPIHIKQLTEAEFLKLKEKYKAEQIAETVLKIENRKDLRKKYSNLYRTLINWLKTNYD